MSSNKIIFDVTLAYLRLLEKQIITCNDQEEIQKVLNPNNVLLQDTNAFMAQLKIACQDIKQTHIDFYRPVCHKEVLD